MNDHFIKPALVTQCGLENYIKHFDFIILLHLLETNGCRREREICEKDLYSVNKLRVIVEFKKKFDSLFFIIT